MENLGDIPGTPLEAALAAAKPAEPEKAKKPPRERASRAKPAAERTEELEAEPKAKTHNRHGERLFTITLHDSDEIPPNGQFVGVNGDQYLIKPGYPVRVPASVLEVLNNAVQGKPVLDGQMRVESMRQAPRLTYTLHPEAA